MKSALQMKSLRGEIQKGSLFGLEIDEFHFTAPFRVRGDSVAGGIVSPFERTDMIGFHQR